MQELEIIEQQIAFLHAESKSRALDMGEIKNLESLIRSKMLILGSASTQSTEQNPFDDVSGDALRELFKGIQNSGESNEH